MLCNRAEPEVRAPKRVRHFPGVARELQALLHIDVQGQEQGFPLPLRSLNPTPRSRRPHLRSAAWAMAALPGSRATWLHARPGMPAPPLSWEWPATAGTATPLRRAMDPSRCVIPHYAGKRATGKTMACLPCASSGSSMSTPGTSITSDDTVSASTLERRHFPTLPGTFHQA